MSWSLVTPRWSERDHSVFLKVRWKALNGSRCISKPTIYLAKRAYHKTVLNTSVPAVPKRASRPAQPLFDSFDTSRGQSPLARSHQPTWAPGSFTSPVTGRKDCYLISYTQSHREHATPGQYCIREPALFSAYLAPPFPTASIRRYLVVGIQHHLPPSAASSSSRTAQGLYRMENKPHRCAPVSPERGPQDPTVSWC